MPSPFVTTANTPNENAVTQIGAGGLLYPYAPIISTVGGTPYFIDTSGGRLGNSTGLTLTGTSAAMANTATISGQGATVTLTAAQSGSVCYFDRAAGIVYTLPAPVIGLSFVFLNIVTITSNNASVTTANSGTQFILGSIQLTKSAASPSSFLANGTSNYLIAQNGTTTGGILGGWMEYYAVSSTQWLVTASLIGSGTLATPIT